VTPFEIDVLLWYHARAGDHPKMAENPPVWRPTINSFMELDLLEPMPKDDRTWNACYRITERGDFYVRHGLCAVPLPEKTWQIPPFTTSRPGAPQQEE